MNDRLRAADDWCSGAGTCVEITEKAANTIDDLVTVLKAVQAEARSLSGTLTTETISAVDAAIARAQE